MRLKVEVKVVAQASGLEVGSKDQSVELMEELSWSKLVLL